MGKIRSKIGREIRGTVGDVTITTWITLFVSMLVAPAVCRADTRLVARWDFDEGEGDLARDASGNGNHGKIHGASWVKLKKGYALRFDGRDDYVDCGAGPSLDLNGPVTLELWIRPLGTPDPFREPGIAGKSNSSYALTYYHSNDVWWYIGSGTNHCARVISEDEEEVRTWHHVAGTFDGATLALYIDGRCVRSCPSSFHRIPSGKHFFIGCTVFDPKQADPAGLDVPHFNGMVDAVRVYARPLAPQDILQHYLSEGETYGIDTTGFGRAKLTIYPYPDKGEVVVEVDCKKILQIDPGARMVLELAPSVPGTQPIRKELPPLDDSRIAEVSFLLSGAAPGEYEVRAVLQQGEQTKPVGQVRFHYPPRRWTVPFPKKRVAPAFPPTWRPPAFEMELCEGGGFKIRAVGQSYEVESWFSFPHGGYNRLSVSKPGFRQCEETWHVETRRGTDGKFRVTAGGTCYRIDRELSVQPTRVLVKDTIRNISAEDLGIILYHRLKNAGGEAFDDWYTAGRREMSRKEGAGSPSVFASREGRGVGIVPLDDLFIVQSVLQTESDCLSIGTERFGLPPGESHTLEWAVYPVGRGGYYDFINAVRRDEGRNGGTIDGGFAFISHGPHKRRNIPEPDFLRIRNTKYGCIHCLAATADDPEVSIEGIEFMDFPKERALLKQQIAEIHRQYPGLKVMFHVAHSLYATNRPDRFADSRVIYSDGSHAIWGDPNGDYISKQREAEGWHWYIYYPTPGNSFHDALMRSADVFMDEIGCDGVFMDGFLWGYGGRYTYDRWDGRTVEMDPKTKTISRKIGSVLLLSQPSLIEFSRKVREKGGVIVANNSVITRSIAAEKYLIHVLEGGVGPDLHLAPTVAGLTGPRRIATETDAYRAVLDKLKWGTLHFYYLEGQLTHPSLPARMFPITIREIRSGVVIGDQRIITMRSGVFGWPGSRELHQVHACDGRGVFVPRGFLTTVDSSGVRTEIALADNESAVLEKLPIKLLTDVPVNVRVLQYDDSGFRALFHGAGKALLQLRSGAFEIRPRTSYQVQGASVQTAQANADGVLSVPLQLDGLKEVRVQKH